MTAAAGLCLAASSTVGGDSWPTQDTGLSLELQRQEACRIARAPLTSP